MSFFPAGWKSKWKHRIVYTFTNQIHAICMANAFNRNSFSHRTNTNTKKSRCQLKSCMLEQKKKAAKKCLLWLRGIQFHLNISHFTLLLHRPVCGDFYLTFNLAIFQAQWLRYSFDRILSILADCQYFSSTYFIVILFSINLAVAAATMSPGECVRP